MYNHIHFSTTQDDKLYLYHLRRQGYEAYIKSVFALNKDENSHTPEFPHLNYTENLLRNLMNLIQEKYRNLRKDL